MNTDNGALDFEATINNESLKRSIIETRRQISGLGQIAEQEGKRMDTAFSGAAKTIAAMAGAGMMLGFARQIVTVRGEIQQLDVAFNTMLGSKSKADALMAQIVDTAAKTPFTLTQVANGAKQLLAYQVAAEDVNDTVIRLGNIAAGVSVPLDRLILAYGQVKAKGKLQGDDMRQFAESGVPIVHELAKVMGVADKEISKMVESGKIGFPEVQKVIQNLTDEGGMFYNLMEKQSKTLTGQISNLEDAWARMLNKIGESNEGFLSSIITGATGAVEHYQEIIDILVPIVAAYGAYKAVIIATAAAQKAAAGLTFVKEYMAMGRAIGFATANQLAFNRAALANPYALVAAALVGLGLAIYNVASEQTAAEKAQESYNKAMDDAGNKITEEKSKITSLISVINDESNSREYRNKKLKELIEISPEHLNSLTLETIKTSEGKAAIDAYVLSLEKKIKIQTLESELTASIKRMQDAQAGKENLSWWDNTKAAAVSAFAGVGAAGVKAAEYSYKNNQEVIKAEKDLQEKIKADISNMTSNNKNAGSDVADVVINAEYWEQQVKDAKDALDKLDTRSKTFGKDQADLLAKIAKGEAEINRIRGKKTGGSGKTTEDMLFKINADMDVDLQKQQESSIEKMLNQIQEDDERAMEEAMKAIENDVETFKKAYENSMTTLQKLDAIDYEYAPQIKAMRDAGMEDNAKNLEKKRDAEKADVTTTSLMQSQDWQQLFGNLETMSVSQMIKIRNKLEAEWKKMKLPPDQLKAIRDQMDKVDETIQQKNPFAALKDAFKQYDEAIDEAGKKEALNKMFSSAAGSIDALKGGFDTVIGSIQNMGIAMDEETAAIMGDISNLMNDASSLASSIASGNVMGIVQGSIQLISNAIGAFSRAHDRSIDRSIKRHQANVDQLKIKYQELERAIDKALGTATYDNQAASIRNLKKQQEEYQAMIRDEERKKKTDKGKIKEYEQAIRDINIQIEDIVNGMAEDILGGTVKDIASQLGDAMIEAFAKGENAAEAWGNKVDDIVGDVIRKMIIQKIVEEPVGMIISKYLSKWVDDEGNFAGFDTVMGDATKMGDELNSLSTSISGILNQLPADIQKYLTNSNSNKNSLSGSISATITEDTATLISGYINAIRTNQLNSINIMNSMLMQLNIIAGNTAYNKFLESIDKSLAKLTVDNLRARG